MAGFPVSGFRIRFAQLGGGGDGDGDGDDAARHHRRFY